MFFNDYENRNIVRIFPLEDYKKMDKLDKLQLGVIYIGNDKNKSKRSRRTAKTNDTNTTSFNNNAIQNQWALSKVDKHNLRKYDDDKELICTIKGTSSIVEDTKNLYLDLFEDARIKYNEKQTRNDRKIENYFNHISNDNKRDRSCL